MVQENSQNKNGAPASNNYSAVGIEIDLEELAAAFVEEYRQGKNPDAQEYARRYPEYADDILELFPALLLLEKGGASTSISGVSRRSRSQGEAPDHLDQIKNFTIRREIARGGMGVVYEAWDNVLERVVALKVMKIFPGERKQTINASNVKRESPQDCTIRISFRYTDTIRSTSSAFSITQCKLSTA